MRDGTGEQRKRLPLARVRKARLRRKASRMLAPVCGHVAHYGEGEYVVHLRHAHFEVPRMVSASRVEHQVLYPAVGEDRVNGLSQRLHALPSEHRHVDRPSLVESRDGVLVVRLFYDRDKEVLPVENEEAVRHSVDHGLLPVLDLGDGQRAVRDRLDQRVHREGQLGEFVVPAPVEARTIRLPAVLARLPHAFRHLRERVQQHPALGPEDGKHEQYAHDRHKKRQPPDGGPGRV